MLPTRICLALGVMGLLSGCGYVHFGKLEKMPAGGGEAALATAYSNLSTEQKILKQELVLARKESDTLRTALERGPGANSSDLVARLNEATRELATLRASYARLQTERTAGAASTPATGLGELEEKLAASLRNYTQLQEENARLKSDLDRTRSENTTLGDQLRQVAAQNEQSRQALDMLNGELLAQKEARTRAEQAAEAVRTQLKVVLAQGAGAAPLSLSAARESSAHSTAALQLNRNPSGELTASAELRADTERLRRAAAGPSTGTSPPSRPSAYIVQSGDTLEKIALKHYGIAEQWRAIYEANQTLLADGQPLRIGMEIRLP